MTKLLSVVVLVGLLAVAARSSFLTDGQIQSQQCTSSAYQTVSRATVQSVPSAPIDVITMSTPQSSWTIDCIQVFESPTYNNPLLTSDQVKNCASSIATMSLCQSDASLAQPQWTCNTLVAYQSNPMTSSSYAAATGKQLIFKLQWSTDQTASYCFPRDITVVMVSHANTTPGTQVGASVAFIIVVIGVGILVLVFGAYMLRKITRKFSKREEAVIASNVGLGPYEAAVAAMGVTSPGGSGGATRGGKVIDFYSNAEDPQGMHHGDGGDHVEIAITDTNEVLQSQPMPKPWFRRAEYDGNAAIAAATPETINQTGTSATNARKQLNFASMSPIDGRSGSAGSQNGGSGLRRRGPTLSSMPVNPRMYDDDGKYHNSRPGSRGATTTTATAAYESDDADLPANEIDEDDDVVLTCTDCMLPIRDVDTPQYCAVTGKRHY